MTTLRFGWCGSRFEPRGAPGHLCPALFGRAVEEALAAHELLAPVHGWLTEGFGTLDLKEAKALIEVFDA
jgi:hypothetical protein